MSCGVCGVETHHRPFWAPVLCASDAEAAHARAVERRVCAGCSKSFCISRCRPQRFCSLACRSSVTPAWNKGDGLCFTGGRWFVTTRDGKVIPYARAVMAAHIGRLLTSDELVHHINHDRTDDRIENLQIVTRSEHALLHVDNLERIWERRRAA